jgi:hypothetical protein
VDRKKCERYRSSSSQAPFEIDPSVKPVINDGPGARSQHKEVIANSSGHDLIDKDSELRYLSSVVTECLVSHDRCTGSYVSNLAACIIGCKCLCHSKTHVRDPNSEPQSGTGFTDHQGGGQ